MRFMRLVTSAIIGLAAIGLSTAGDGVGAAEIAVFEGTRTETFTLGPFSLNAQGSPGDQVNHVFAPVQRPEGDIAVRSIEWALVDGDGNAVASEQAHVHHLVLLDTSRPDALCSVGSRFAGTGAELNPFAVPDGYAYRSAEGDWQGVYHLMNRTAAPIDVALQYTVTYTDARVDDYLDVEPLFFDVDGCWGDSEFVVPGDGGPDSVFETSNSYTMERDATILTGGGHIHARGIDMTLTEVGGPEICRSTAVYGGHGGNDGHLTGVEPCGEVNYDVETGDELELTARYRNDAFIPDAMGIMVMYVHYTSPPPPPPTVEITSVVLANGALRVSAVCNRNLDLSLYASVSQTKGKVLVSGYGYVPDRVVCSPDGITTDLELFGDGVLTGGPVDYDLEVYASNGRDYVNDYIQGTTRLQGRVDLAAQVLDEGDIDLVIDGEIGTDGDGHRVVGVSVPCAGDEIEAEVSVSIRQRAGRTYVTANGYEYGQAACTNGVARYSVTLPYTNGRLAGGPAAITASVYVYGDFFEYATRSTTARLTGTTRPVDAAAGYTPDPGSRLTITDVVEENGMVVVRASLTGCLAGATVYVDASLTSVDGRGRRAGADEAYGYNDEHIACDGGEQIDVELLTYGRLSTKRVGVRVTAYEDRFIDGNYVSQLSSNAGVYRIR